MIYTQLENKDFKRVQKLIDNNDDGTNMCKVIKDMNKAIRRYVVARILTAEGPLRIEDYRNKNYGKYSSFCKRAIELGATYFDIIVNFIKPDDLPNVIDWIIDEYLNETQIEFIMNYKNHNYHSNERLFNYVIINCIDVGDREGLACDIVKIFL